MVPPGLLQFPLTPLVREKLEAEARRRGLAIPGEPLPEPQRLTFSDLRIADKAAQLVPLSPNPVQRAYLEDLEGRYPGFRHVSGDLAALGGAREVILKARQQGFSTLIEAILYLYVTSTPHSTAWIVADTDDRAETLFLMVQRFHANDPRQLRTRALSRRELAFADLDSRIRVATAGGRQTGRAATIHCLHMSEVAFWPDPAERGALLQSVPDGGLVFEETTANGLNEFYEHYLASQAGTTGHHAHFSPWFANPEYSTRPFDGWEIPAERREWAAQYDLTDAQVYWYERKRAELSTTNTPIEQEHPSNDVEAFLISAGGAYFDTDYLFRLQAEGLAEPCETIKAGDRGFGADVVLYDEPRDGAAYVVAADVAEGLTDDGDHDYSAALVLDLEDAQVVARYRGRVDTRWYASDLGAIATHYNCATVMVERNNMGLDVVHELESLGIAQYAHRVVRRYGGKPVEETVLGFPASVRTKALADAALKAEIALCAKGLGSLGVNDAATCEELLHYVNLPGGRRGGEARYHDDLVAALRMAWWYRNECWRPEEVLTVRQRAHEDAQEWRGYGSMEEEDL